MNNISVFGGTGFIGSKWLQLYPNISYCEPRESVCPKHNTVLYFRATNSNYNVFSDISLDVNTNLLLLTETLKNITPNHTFILISSWFCFNPKGFYSITKLCQEQLLKSYCKTFNIKHKILRLSNIIGNDPKANAKKNALEYLIQKIKNNEDINLYQGDNYRNFLDVESCCRAIKYVMDFGKNNTLYNIGADQSYKIGDILNYCIKKTNSKSKITIIPPPKFHRQVQVENFWMDTSKLQKLGFNNKFDIYKFLDSLL